MIHWLVVWNHGFLWLSIQLGISSSQLTFTPSFFRGVSSNHQPLFNMNRNCQWIGLRENWNRKAPLISWENTYGFRFRFSLKPIHWIDIYIYNLTIYKHYYWYYNHYYHIIPTKLALDMENPPRRRVPGLYDFGPLLAGRNPSSRIIQAGKPMGRPGPKMALVEAKIGSY